MALQIDVKVVVPLACAGGARLKARHRHAMGFERYKQVVHGPRAVGHRHHQTDAILARGGRHGQGVGQADHGKAGAVVCVVLNRVGRYMQGKLAGRPLAGDACPGRIGRGQTRALGVAGDGPSLGFGQVPREPVLALRQGLRVRQHGFNAIQRIVLAQQMVAHAQADLTHHVGGRLQEQIQRARDHAFGRVFHAHHTVVGAARCGGLKDIIKIGAVHQLHSAAKVFDGRLLTKRACGPEHRHALRFFQRQASRHDFAPNGSHVVCLEWPGIGVANALQHLGHAVGPKEGAALGAFDLAHFTCQCGTLVQQRQKLRVQRVNALAQRSKGGVGCVSHG